MGSAHTSSPEQSKAKQSKERERERARGATPEPATLAKERQRERVSRQRCLDCIIVPLLVQFHTGSGAVYSPPGFDQDAATGNALTQYAPDADPWTSGRPRWPMEWRSVAVDMHTTAMAMWTEISLQLT